MKTRLLFLLSCLASVAAAPLSTRAAILGPTDAASYSGFGYAASQAGTLGVVGAYSKDASVTGDEGALYLYRNLGLAIGFQTQTFKLTASDATSGDQLGVSVSLSGTNVLAGANTAEVGSNGDQGAAYVFRNLDTITADGTESIKLTSSDGAGFDQFGNSVSLAGGIGLVGAYGHNSNQGAAYLYRNLDTATGLFTENARLIAGDASAQDFFGISVSVSGTIGLVGAQGNKVGSNSFQGSAYVFRNLDTATGNVADNAILISSDGAAFDNFGSSADLSGSIGLVGAPSARIGSNSYQGAAYVFRNLDTAAGAVTETIKLTASDGAANDFFGSSVNISGSIALVGATNASVDGNTNQGAVYLFRGLDTATGTLTETLKITRSGGTANDTFGSALALQGNQFIIGASGYNNYQGTAVSGSINSMTTLDTGDTIQDIDGFSFVSKVDWIIGQTTSSNAVNFANGDAAEAPFIQIGAGAGSNNNSLTISGSVLTTYVTVGSTAGSKNNVLTLTPSAAVDLSAFRLTPGNGIFIPGDYPTIVDLLTYLDERVLQIWNGTAWETISTANASSIKLATSLNGYTYVSQPAPLPDTRVISLSGSLSFGSHKINSKTRKTLTISNRGTAPLRVTRISLPSGFTGKFTGTIAAGSSRRITITFRPTKKKTYRGSVTVTSNNTSGSETKSVSGKGK